MFCTADPPGIDMAVQNWFKMKLSVTVVKSNRSTSQVEGFNSEMVCIWGSGTNMSTLLADFKLMAMITWWDLRTIAGISGLLFIANSDIARLAAIRALRRELKLPDKYCLVPYLE